MTKLIHEIQVVDEIGFSEFEKMLRGVELSKPDEDGNKILIYQDAEINFHNVNPAAVNFPQFYVLEDQLQRQEDIRELLLKQDIDTFNLEAAFRIVNQEGEEWLYSPPIVEDSQILIGFAKDDRQVQGQDRTNYEGHQERLWVPLWMDGSHRGYTANKHGSEIKVVHISPPVGNDDSLMQKFPYYALPNGIGSVKVVDEVPKDKKRYVVGDAYALYRNMGPLGMGSPRKAGSRD